MKRRTQLANINTKDMPQAGDAIQLEGHEEAIGQIVRAASAPDGGVTVLVEIRLENLDSTTDLPVWKGKKLEFKALPYTLT